jgi:hypothetical protein
MNRKTFGSGAAALSALIVFGHVAEASAAPSDVAQPTYATVGQAYSFQIIDAIHGTPTFATWVAGPNLCVAPGYEPGLPQGLEMSWTGLISGTPVLTEQTQFCADLELADGTRETVQMTMTVGTGNATVDPLVIPQGTTVHGMLDAVINPIVTGLQHTCIMPGRYCQGL